MGDALYVRILNVEQALSSCLYEQDGQIVFTVTDDMSYTTGTYPMSVAGGAATVVSTTYIAEVTLGARELGALSLGRVCADVYASTGYITGDSAAMRTPIAVGFRSFRFSRREFSSHGVLSGYSIVVRSRTCREVLS